MVVTLPGAATSVALPAAAASFTRAGGQGTPARWSYGMYGLRVASEVALPLPEADSCSGASDWTVRLVSIGPVSGWPQPAGSLIFEQRCDCPTHAGQPFVRVHRGPGGDWIWNDHAGLCHVLPDGRRVDVYRLPQADEGALALQILGPVSGRVLHRLGYPPLHGAAVVAEGVAFAFVGPAGHGKTTLAAAFLRRGAALLSDDILPLRATPDGVDAAPGAPLMKLWPPTVRGALEFSAELPDLAAHLTKKRLTLGGPDSAYPLATAPAPLRALYVPQRFDPDSAAGGGAEITIEPLSGRAALTVLMAQTYRVELLRPEEQAALLPLYARLLARSPLRLLRYPNGFAHQDAVCARVLADARGLR